MNLLQPNLKYSTYKILTGTFLLIGLTLLILRIIDFDIPRLVSSGVRLATGIFGVMLYMKLSKFIPAKSLIDYWYKNIQAVYYFDDKIKSNNISLSQSAIDSITAYKEIIDEINEIIKENGEDKKLKKVKRKFYYSEPYDIFEALSDCNRFSHELERVLKKKNYPFSYTENLEKELGQLNYSLKEIYKYTALSKQKKLPKWVRE